MSTDKEQVFETQAPYYAIANIGGVLFRFHVVVNGLGLLNHKWRDKSDLPWDVEGVVSAFNNLMDTDAWGFTRSPILKKLQAYLTEALPGVSFDDPELGWFEFEQRPGEPDHPCVGTMVIPARAEVEAVDHQYLDLGGYHFIHITKETQA